MATRDILIVGATGRQGRSTIDALFASVPPGNSSTRVLALTRSATSPKSLALKSAHPEIILVEGDTCDPAPIFGAWPTISAVFLVTVPPNDEKQALPFLETAVASSTKVDHTVFTSVDRGGDEASWAQPTSVPHFAAKHRVELRLRKLCDDAGRRWTILRPTSFMETFNPAFFGKLMASMWALSMPADRRMQMVSTRDIGRFAAKALLDPEAWAGRAVALAGDELSFTELQDVFRRTVGQELPQTYGVLAQPVLWLVEDAAKSFEWFSTVGYGADIEHLRGEEPRLQSFEKWLRESSQWKIAGG
ncbi:nucleoside-diphosphate-sugar epimerase family protein [Thozetella sp. PMI_491]|nr:nucleoside-diphosphate-sugar epimerase family protein [Thozetella sp. PMI_491]